MIIGLFLHNPSDLNSKTLGGVQICSQEFLKVIQASTDKLYHFEVNFNKALFFRILYKLNLDNYISYDTKKYYKSLISIIKEKQISHVFINKSELIRYSKIIKDELPNVKVIIMSHGNDSGDLLSELTDTTPRFKGVKKITGILKLGMCIFTESFYRKRYVDLVCTMSEEESALEKWLGQNNTFYIPRLIDKTVKISRAPIKHVFGYVGTLNHSPNIVALHKLFKELSKYQLPIEIRVVGQPFDIGKNLQHKYTFVKYLGPLNDDDLKVEVGNWSYFINPIFNYSRGASMKLMKTIEWEIPTITTLAGKRGYQINEGSLLETSNNPASMAMAITNFAKSTPQEYQKHVDEIIAVKRSSISVVEIKKILRQTLLNLYN